MSDSKAPSYRRPMETLPDAAQVPVIVYDHDHRLGEHGKRLSKVEDRMEKAEKAQAATDRAVTIAFAKVRTALWVLSGVISLAIALYAATHGVHIPAP